MILDIKLPNLHLPRKTKLPSRNWQRWLILVPRFVYSEGKKRRRLMLPGWHETRVSFSENRRVWRDIPKGAHHD